MLEKNKESTKAFAETMPKEQRNSYGHSSSLLN